MYRVGVIGTGVVGSAVALLLRQKGYSITRVCSRTGVSAALLAGRVGCRCVDDPAGVLAEAEIVFVTVADRELGPMADRLASCGLAGERHVFLHMSGALPAEVLAPLRERGASVGSVHPLQSFASVEKAVENLPGSFFAIQGDDRACRIAFEIADALEGRPFLMKSDDKPLYHMSACVASNYLVSLVHCAVRILQSIGMSRQQSVDALLPLIRGTLSNIETLGPARALTGPVARGDADTVRRHLAAAEGLAQELREVYKTLGLYTVEVGLEKGSIDRDTAAQLRQAFRKEEDK